MSVDAEVALGVPQRFPLGDAQLLAHEIEPRDLFGDGMLHLQTRVDLEKKELLAAQQKLHGARRGVAQRLRGRQRSGPHPFAQLRVHGGRGRFLDDLLVPALDRTLTLEQVHEVAVMIAQDLDLDVA